VGAVRALAWRGFADSRIRNLSFALLFALYAAGQTAGYRSTYPTPKDRLQFAQSFGDNKALRLFYGVPHDLLTSGGYAAWRVGGVLSIFAAAWGLMAAVKAMRGEEDSGRQELVLAGAVGRRSAFGGALAAIGAGAAALWLAMFLGLLVAKLPAGESAYMALATLSVALVFVGVGAIASQLASTRRLALELGGAALALAFLLRVVADTSSHLGGLRWLTPLGWAEEMRPFTGARPAVLLLPAAAATALLIAAGLIWLRRDVGEGLVQSGDTAAPSLELLSSPTSQALRGERGSLLAWLVGSGVFALVVGVLSDSVSSVNVSNSLERQLQKLGVTSVTMPSGYLGFSFLFFVLVVSLFACSQVAAARHEEAEQRTETLFALPVGRREWLGGRLLLACGGAVALSLFAGVLAWAGAASQGAGVSLGDGVAVGANCLPAAVLFLAVAALAFALIPRASSGLAYGLVLLAFVWELFGSLLSLPAWTLDISPFHQVGLVPAEPFKATAAIAMLGIAALAAFAAVRIFEQRDLTGV
jgi:ABC-2 type transport system permease protein